MILQTPQGRRLKLNKALCGGFSKTYVAEEQVGNGSEAKTFIIKFVKWSKYNREESACLK